VEGRMDKKQILSDEVMKRKRPWWLENTLTSFQEYEGLEYEEKYIYCLHCQRVYHYEEFEKNYEIWKQAVNEKGFDEANKLRFCPTNRIYQEECNANPIDFHGYMQGHLQDKKQFPFPPVNGKLYPLYD